MSGDGYEGGYSGCPMHAAPGGSGQSGDGTPSIYGKSDLTYNEYLKVPELLDLQIPQSEPAHHDEMLFIVIHQAYELWFKLILHEMETAISYMREGKILRAHHFVNRINQIMKLLVQQIHILETMTPAEFLQFRDRLKPASGFQSTQFREIEFVAGLKDRSYFKHFQSRPAFIERLEKRYKGDDFRSAFYALLRQQGFAVPENASEAERSGDASVKSEVMSIIKPIYQDPASHSQLYMLAEALVEFDESLVLWRQHHVHVVERVIGFKQGTGGSSGVEYLRSTTTKKSFPWLWEVRTYLE